jgi:hypothetical protein
MFLNLSILAKIHEYRNNNNGNDHGYIHDDDDDNDEAPISSWFLQSFPYNH